jgi:2,3-bisphosphoglycerate-dependent phosphoglycerate mutase
MKRVASLTFLAVIFLAANGYCDQGLTTVILVRHAEKSTVPEKDPELTRGGQARAFLIARKLKDAGITAVYATQYKRTQLTAQPLADQLRLRVIKVDAENSKQLVSEVRKKHSGGTLLVVGHSNTLGEIIEMLGGEKIAGIADEEYDNLFIVTLGGTNQVKVLRLRF